MKPGNTSHRFRDPLRLTPAEEKIYELKVSGKSIKEIAENLGLSERTIQEALKKAKEKVTLRSIFDAQDRRISWP